LTPKSKPALAVGNVIGLAIGALVVVAGIIVAFAIALRPEPPPPPLPSAAPEAAPTPAAIVPQVQETIVSLNPSKSQMRGSFEALGYVFESTPLATGMPRLTGQQPKTASTIELIGRGDLVERTSLMLGFANDDPDGLIWNTGAMTVFMRALGWTDGVTWISKKVNTGGKTSKDGVAYEVTGIPDTGIVVISASPDTNNKGAGSSGSIPKVPTYTGRRKSTKPDGLGTAENVSEGDSTSGTPAPKPSAGGPCGCSPTDLPCNMRCQAKGG
jgi:hypothetical protein